MLFTRDDSADRRIWQNKNSDDYSLSSEYHLDSIK